jgi:ATP-dependent exoDNAse (exonuclease V) alpha subunit
MVQRWRERWAELANERLAELDIDAPIDHRSLEAQGIALEPQSQIGAPAQRIEGEGDETADRVELHREIARNNGERIIADPSVAPSRISNRRSRSATLQSSRIATATESTDSTRLWARCVARPIWSNSARTFAARTASRPAP